MNGWREEQALGRLLSGRVEPDLLDRDEVRTLSSSCVPHMLMDLLPHTSYSNGNISRREKFSARPLEIINSFQDGSEPGKISEQRTFALGFRIIFKS